MKRFLLVLILSSSIHAETEEEFVERITAAWESRDPEKILALYGENAVNDSEIRKLVMPRIELEAKTSRVKSASILPFTPGASGPGIMAGEILFTPSAQKSVALEMHNDDPKNTGSFTKISLLVKNKQGSFSLGIPSYKTFEWTGPKLDSFRIVIKPQSEGDVPSVAIVVETCDRVTWKTMSGNGPFQFGAHKILQLVIPPAKGGDQVTVEISRNDDEPFFKKTIDISNGAVVPIESTAH
jgi:hypothetical protein